MDRSHGGRVVHEVDVERAMTEQVASAIAAGVGAGITLTGKTVTATQVHGVQPMALDIVFDDGSAVRLHGVTHIETFGSLASEEQPAAAPPQGAPQRHVGASDAEVIEDAEWKEVS